MHKNFTNSKLSKWLTTSISESRPSYRKSQNNKRTTKLDFSRRSKTRSSNSVLNLRKFQRSKSNVTCRCRTLEKLTLSFPLILNSITSFKTDKPSPVPYLPSNNCLAKRKAESKPKSMANSVPKIRTPTKNGMTKSNTKETERTSEISMKRLKSFFMKLTPSLPWKMMTIDLFIMIALTTLIFTQF